MNLRQEFPNYKNTIKIFLLTFGVLVGQMIAWFFILPLDYTYIPSSFFIVRWLPIPCVGLFLFYICWRTWNTPIKQQKNGDVSQ